MNSKIYETLQRSLKSISRNYIDEFVEPNAEFRAKAGLREKIIRSTNGKCCKWCDKLAGIYDYPAPKDVYRRHDNCDCTVTDISEKGAQDVHTKDMLKAKEIEERIEKLSNTAALTPNKLEDVKKEYFRRSPLSTTYQLMRAAARKKHDRIPYLRKTHSPRAQRGVVSASCTFTHKRAYTVHKRQVQYKTAAQPPISWHTAKSDQE